MSNKDKRNRQKKIFGFRPCNICKKEFEPIRKFELFCPNCRQTELYKHGDVDYHSLKH